MGYDVHITRKEQWFDEEGPTISLDEWKAFVRSDPEMRLDGFAEAIMGDGSTLRVESEGMAVWTVYSGNEKDGNMAWFSFFDGDVRVKNPDPEILRKMWTIAERLGAKVQGDEGEVYDSSGNSDESPPLDSPPGTDKKPWWKFW